ncbi:hypothetical protein AKI39_08485 [Bordetella sp. H567]|uniref:type 4b pilus protein PilO2 n=1 Tax=Bordetella sp. H567 TaxID=1697043 RepID=UPI00081CFF01|nr:type 4b pilus protein PilO2 [Bordetella sp. H567]AOB30724.1 hypothetical protein AKI39_08485 [Bordetella sp. H567]
MAKPITDQTLPQALGDHFLLPMRDGAVLVFGLTWFPLIGSRMDMLARRKARESRATHYVHGGAGTAAVGCARLRGRAKACYAAAQVFAASHAQGTAAGLLPLDDGRVWLVASRNGSVMARGDRLHANEAAARAALAELDALYPGLAEQARHLSVDELGAAIDPAACLWRAGTLLSQLPLPVQGTVLLVVLALLAPPAWRAWQRAIPSPSPARVDPAQAWRDALARAVASVRIHDADQLGRVFGTLRTLPVALQGWAMQSARCRPDGAAWACSARYTRTAPGATNRALAQHLPATVRPSFTTLDEAHLLWRVEGRARTLRPEILRDAAQTDIDFASTLQAIRPAFARIALGVPAALAVSPPRDESGSPLPAPADLPRMRQRNVVLQGPLRSFALFASPRAVASWTAIGLELHGDRRPDIAHSPLMAQLEGTVYERE